MIVTGAPGVGKTQFCLQLMNAFSVGGMFLTSELVQKTVLVLSLEMDVRELKFVLQKQSLSFQKLKESSQNSRIVDEPGSFLQYEELFEKFRPGVVIIDSLFEFSDGDVKDGPEVIQLTRWLKRMRKKYDMAMVIIHHNRKATTTNKKPNTLDDIFGSVVINKAIDTGISLWKEKDDPYIDLDTVKARYSEEKHLKIKRTDNLVFEIVEESEIDRDRSGPIVTKTETGTTITF